MRKCLLPIGISGNKLKSDESFHTKLYPLDLSFRVDFYCKFLVLEIGTKQIFALKMNYIPTDLLYFGKILSPVIPLNMNI